MEPSPEFTRKVNILNALSTLTERERKFVSDMMVWKNVSMAQAGFVDRLYAEKVEKAEKQAKDKKLILGDRVSAFRMATGWQIYIDNKAVGVILPKSDAETIARWLSMCMDMLEYVLKQPKPNI